MNISRKKTKKYLKANQKNELFSSFRLWKKIILIIFVVYFENIIMPIDVSVN